MKRKSFSVEQIVTVLKQVALGLPWFARSGPRSRGFAA